MHPDKDNVYTGSLINSNGKFLTPGFQAIRVFDPVAKNYSVVGQLDRARFDPTLVTLGDGNVLVLGGTQQVTLCSAPHAVPLHDCLHMT